MTAPISVAPQFAQKQLAHYERMKMKAVSRDQTHHIVHEVRNGKIQQLFPDDFTIELNGSPIANFIDVVARDMAEGIGPLPALACVSGRMKTDADLARAETKNKIGLNYWRNSRLEIGMLPASDRYVTYGYTVGIVEPDFKHKMPYINLVDSRHCYYEKNRFGDVVRFARKFTKTIDELCAQYPENRSIIVGKSLLGEPPSGDTCLDVVQYIDETSVSLFLPERSGLLLNSYQHMLSRTPVRIAERPGESDQPRGQFDDVIWVQVARALMATYALEGAALAVQAPIAIPEDMDEFPFGAHAILQSNQAKDIHRVGIDIPANVFAEGQLLDQELRTGARYPDARTGSVQASVITGKGVQALLGTFDAQIKGAQLVMKDFLEGLTSMCFEMDEVWWGNESKQVTGTLSGSSYEFDYTPKKDINGRYSCTVTYGFAAGMQPSQSIITLMQLDGSGLIAHSTTQENLPFSIDAVQEGRKIAVERWRDAVNQGMFAYLQAAGQIAEQGGDPTDLFGIAVGVIRRIQDGVPEEEAVIQAYQEMQAAKQAREQAAADAQAQAQAAAGPSINGSNGLPEGVAAGQAGLPPGGLPTISRMIAGFRGNGTIPVNEATVQRRVATGI